MMKLKSGVDVKYNEKNCCRYDAYQRRKLFSILVKAKDGAKN